MDDDIRVSDADRDRVADQLRDHFAAGRITSTELDERLLAALGAKTFGDLRRIMADLPGPVPALPNAAPPPLRATPTWALRRRPPPVPPLIDLAVLADDIHRRRRCLRATAPAAAPSRQWAAPPAPLGAPLHVAMTAPRP